MPVLVTGGSGFLAINLAEALLRRGEVVILFSRHAPPPLATAFLSSLGGRLHSVMGDVQERSALVETIRTFGVDRAFHGAAITANLERERRDPASIFGVNLGGTLEILEAAQATSLRRLVYLSSSSVYGKSAFGVPVLDEAGTLPLPDTFYAISKYAAERASLRFKETRGLDVVVARVGTAFGPWERETGVRDTLSAPMQATRLALEGRPAILPRPGRKDWVYSREVAAALVALAETAVLRHDVYNIGPGVEWTIEAWCEKLRTVFPGFSFRVARPGEPPTVDYHTASERAPFAIDRLVQDTGYRPRVGLDEAFQDYMDWLKRFADFWK